MGWARIELSRFGRFEVAEPVSDLLRDPRWTTVPPDPGGHDASSRNRYRIGLSPPGVPPGLLKEDHARAPEPLRPSSDPQPISKKNLTQVVHFSAHMDRPTSSRELVVGETAVPQDFEAGLLEIVEIDGVVDVPEGVQLVGASVDYCFGDAQCLSP